MLLVGEEGWISILLLAWTQSRQVGITTPSWDRRLHRTAPTCEALAVAGRGCAHPHDPTHTANSPRAFISLSVTVTHALRLPVYRLFSQGPCRGNGRAGGTGLLAQVLKGNPSEVWEWEGRGRSGMPACWDRSEGMEATEHPVDWLHPGAQGDAGAGTASLPGIALAAGRPRGRGGYHPHGSISKRSSVTSLEMVPTLPPFISHQWVSGVPTPLGPGMGVRGAKVLKRVAKGWWQGKGRKVEGPPGAGGSLLR